MMNDLSNAFPRTRLQETFAVQELVSLHYFEFSKDFSFEGERHDFWEFVYADKGELAVFADTEGYLLKQGDMIFHQPNEFHGVWANRLVAPNVMIVSFVIDSPAMASFANTIVTLGQAERDLLAEIMKNAMAAFHPPFDNPHNHSLHRRSDAPIGAEQMIRLHLELLLLRLYYAQSQPQTANRLSSTIKEQSEADLVRRMKQYMEAHICEDIRLEQVCTHLNLSKSHAVSLFKQITGQSIMKYYRQIRLEYAKQRIREGRATLTEISDQLGYNSMHSFSRQFKQLSGMSPSEYARTIQARF